jgi:hypothetical protein
LLLTILASAALIQLRRRWKTYRAELNRLETEQTQYPSRHRVELTRSEIYRL